MHPNTDFHNRLGAAMKLRETTQNMSFRHKRCGAKPNWCLEHRNGVKIPKNLVLDLKECIEIFHLVCLESYYSETFNQMHPDTSFRNGSGASMKWRETTQNMSFGPKVRIGHVRF